MTNIDEVWKDVLGYEGFYQVSNQGRVKGLLRVVKCTHKFRNSNTIQEKILSTPKDSRGYSTVHLSRPEKRTLIRVHRLVIGTFIGVSDLHVDHINGIRTDNRLDNLRYCTPSQNSRFAVTSKYKLIGSAKNRNKWRSSIFWEGKRIHLGMFDTPEQAHERYKSKLIELETTGIGDNS